MDEVSPSLDDPPMTLSSMDEVPPSTDEISSSMDGIVICQILLMFYKVLG